MELLVNEEKRELKSHGTFQFPVNISRKRLSSYGTGAFPWHWHDEVELTLVLSGKIDYRVNESQYLLRAGEGLFCNADALHAGSRVDGADCDYVSLTFHPRLLGGYEGCILRSKYVDSLVGAFPSLRLSPQESWQRHILEAVEKIYQLSQSQPETYELEVQRLLLGIWSGLYRHRENQAAAPAGPERVERLRVILSYLHENYGEKITLEDVAKQVGLCKSECCRFFKRQMGQSLFDYLLDYRIGRSLALLEEGGATVAEVMFGALSYIALNFTVGDFVTLVGEKIGKGLESVAEASPQLYDLMLSTWSSMGVLPDVGLAGPVTALDAQTRKELTSSLLESFELSLRMNLIGMLVQSAMHMAVLGTLIPLMLCTRYGQGEEFTPLCNLETVRIPARLNLVLMLGVLVLWVLILVNDSFYAVYSAAWSLVQYIYGLQGLSVCEWFLKKHGWKKGWRYLLMGAGYVLLPTVLFLIGFLEQIFYFRKIGRPRPEDFGLKGPDDRDDDEM